MVFRGEVCTAAVTGAALKACSRDLQGEVCTAALKTSAHISTKHPLQKRGCVLFNLSLLCRNFFAPGMNASHSWDVGDGCKLGFFFARSQDVVESDCCTRGL